MDYKGQWLILFYRKIFINSFLLFKKKWQIFDTCFIIVYLNLKSCVQFFKWPKAIYFVIYASIKVHINQLNFSICNIHLIMLQVQMFVDRQFLLCTLWSAGNYTNRSNSVYCSWSTNNPTHPLFLIFVFMLILG